MKKSKINVDNSLQNMNKLFEIINKLDPTNVSGSQGSFNEQIKQLEKKAKKLKHQLKSEYKDFLPKENLDSKK